MNDVPAPFVPAAARFMSSVCKCPHVSESLFFMVLAAILEGKFSTSWLRWGGGMPTHCQPLTSTTTGDKTRPVRFLFSSRCFFNHSNFSFPVKHFYTF